MKDEMFFLKIDLEMTAQRINRAICLHSGEINKMIENGVNNACTPEYLQNYINDRTNHHIKQAINEEIDTFYRHGKGREIIRDAVNKKLNSPT